MWRLQTYPQTPYLDKCTLILNKCYTTPMSKHKYNIIGWDFEKKKKSKFFLLCIQS